MGDMVKYCTKTMSCVIHLRSTAYLASNEGQAAVQVWDAGTQIQDMSAAHDAKAQRGKRLPQRPMHMHAHSTEGYALAWSSVAEGRLASGDCRRGIHVWDPNGSGAWTVSGAYAVRSTCDSGHG